MDSDAKQLSRYFIKNLFKIGPSIDLGMKTVQVRFVIKHRLQYIAIKYFEL